MISFRSVCLTLTLASVVLVPGCSRRDRKTQAGVPTIGFAENVDDIVVLAFVDVSGSFQDKLFGKDAKAYACLQRLINSLHQDGARQRCRLVLCQIGGTDKPLLWEGEMTDFRRTFGSDQAFRSFIISRANTQGSRVADSISDAISHVLSSRSVEKGKSRIACVVLSDMLDNVHTPNSQARLAEELRRLAEHESAIGLYFVDQLMVDSYQTLLKNSGFRPSRLFVSADFSERTPLPNLK